MIKKGSFNANASFVFIIAAAAIGMMARNAPAAIVFSENFEGAEADVNITTTTTAFTSITGLTTDATAFARTDTTPFFTAGTKYLEYIDNTAAASPRLQLSLPAEAADPINLPNLKQITNSGFSLSFDFYEPAGIGVNSVRVGLANGSFNTTLNRMVELVIYAPSETELGDAGYIDGSKTQQNLPDAAFAPNTMRHIDVVGVVGNVPGGSISYLKNGSQSVANNTYDIWVDGVRLADNATFRNDFTVITDFAILNSGASSTQTVYFDNVVLRNDIPGAALKPGDFDSDGDVDGADFVAWQTNFPKPSGAVLAEGDADGDGDVDGADFVVWQTNFPFTPGPGAAPVPEPGAIVLAGFAAAAMALGVRRRRN
jgi:hypothetical protein